MRFASIAFVKHTVYKRSRQGCTPDPHRNQKSGSPCPINPPELEIPSRLPGRPVRSRAPLALAHLPPVPGAFPWASTGWGDTVVTKSFLCVAFCALRVARTMPTNPFFYRRFSASPARQRAFPGWACPFPPVRERGLPRASTGLCARVCVSFPGCQGTPRVKPSLQSPIFSDGGSRYGPGKGKRLPTFFTSKSEVFCGVAEPLAGFSLGGPVNFWAPPACSDYRNIRSIHKTKKSRAWMGAALWVAVLS